MKNQIREHNYLLACELIKREIGNDNFNELLKDNFQRPGYLEAEIHKAIYELGSRLVITPNFDCIYDNYAKKISSNTVQVKSYTDSDIANWLRNKDPFILKIHGSIENTTEIIFSKFDYSRARLEHSNFYKLLEALILTHTFIFLGAGLDDPDIQLLFENVAFRYPAAPKHIFVAPEKNRHQNKILDIFAQTMNLCFLKYDPKDNHKELTDSLKSLVQLVEAKRDELASTYNW